VRTGVLAGGALVAGLLLGLLVGLVAGRALGGSEQAQAPRTVTVTEREFVTVTATPSPSPTATATASPGASLQEGAVNEECSVGQICDLTTGEVTITNVERTDAINTMGTTYAGEFIVVWFDYTYKGDSTAETGECPWSLIDSEGNTYSMNFDATSSYGIEANAPVAIYEEVQPGVTKPGLVVFEVAPGSQPQALIISDLVNVQGGDVAKVEL
jgi:hypothetical protein